MAVISPMINITFMPYHHPMAFCIQIIDESFGKHFNWVLSLTHVVLTMLVTQLKWWQCEHFWATSQHGLAHSIYKICSNWKDILKWRHVCPRLNEIKYLFPPPGGWIFVSFVCHRMPSTYTVLAYRKYSINMYQMDGGINIIAYLHIFVNCETDALQKCNSI